MKCDRCGKDCNHLVDTFLGWICQDCVNELYQNFEAAKEIFDSKTSKKRGYAQLTIEIKEDSQSLLHCNNFEEGFYDLVDDTIKEIKEHTGYTANIELMYIDNFDEEE